MKVTVKNPSNKPINISKLAPLMPVQVLGVNQEIVANVRDIDSVTKNAKKIGVTVTPVEEALKVTKVVEPKSNKVDTTSKDKVETEKTEPESEVVTTDPTPTETNEVTPELVETEKVDEVVGEEVKTEPKAEEKETKPKKSVAKKSAKAKKSATKKSIFGNNK